jgi:tetratricopeptide (TPR) repeat protein/transcriptional regulator with XRE-family HTH domain
MGQAADDGQENRRLGGVLRQMRQEAGLSQEALAERAGLSVRTIRNLEAGRIEQPHGATIARLVDALGLDHQYAAQLQSAWRRAAQPLESSRGPADVPRQLPPDIPCFVERHAEQAALDDLLTWAGTGVSGPIAAICGTGGVGKTALAVRWAHTVRGRFPDGELYAELGGYGRGEQVDPGTVLASWLRALGMPEERVPGTVDEKTAQLRTVLADRRVLVLIDNVGSADQARPLMAGAGGCFTVVTSRDSLSSLVALDGAIRLIVEPLTEEHARTLLGALLGAGLAEEPAAVEELVRYCCGLPLAVRIAAELANARPTTPLRTLAAQLRDERRRLEVLDLGDDRGALRSVFSWSYRSLSPPAARLFRLLGVDPAGDIDEPAAAAMAGVDAGAASTGLTELTRAHLLRARGDRHTMHDLLRAYAVGLAEPADHARGDHLLDYRLAAATAAVQVFAPSEAPVLPPLRHPPGTLPRFCIAPEARAWLDEHLRGLLAGAAWAAEHRRDRHVVELSAVLRRYLFLCGHSRPALSLHGRAYRAAQRLRDVAAEGASLSALAQIRWRLGDPAEALRRFRQALPLHRAAGDTAHETATWGGLGSIYADQRRFDDALECFQRALELAESTGDRRSEALVLGNLGNIHRWSGRPEEALEYYERCLAALRRLGDRANEGVAHANLGEMHRQAGRMSSAAAHFHRALRIAQDTGDAANEADIRTHLGLIAVARGDLDEALRLHLRAIEIAQQMGLRPREAAALDHLGLVHQRLGDYAAAAERHGHALAIAEAVADTRRRCSASNGLGEAMLGLGRTDAARRWHAAALRLATASGFPDESERALRSLSETLVPAHS